MYTKRSSPHTFFILLNIIMILTVLIGSAASPTNAHALGVLITVTTIIDNTNTDTVCSLREAITNANSNSAQYPDCGSGLANDVIVFADALGTATITLNSALPAISDTWGLTINGGGKITISGNKLYQVFFINPSIPLTLDGLTVINGGTLSSSSGGIFNNSGTLTITNSTFSNNASTAGGGIYNSSGLLTITSSTFSNNVAFGGGGIYNRGTLTITNSTFSSNGSISSNGGSITNIPGATATITNSTFSGNTSGSGYGGAIFNKGTLNLKNNTIAGNLVMPNQGGGIYNDVGSTLNQFNNIIANNDGGDCINLGTLSGNNNLIKSAGSDACGLTNSISGNIIGVDPNLSALTGSPAYFPLLAGSPAINTGDDAICAAAPVSNTSQNGVARPQGAHCDIGSYEFIPDVTPPTVSSIVRASPNPTSAASVNFTVTFSESVTGVDPSDFTLTTNGVSGAAVSGVSGSDTTYTVSVTTGSGIGTIRLDLVNDGTIKDIALNPLATGFTSGDVYTITKSPTFADVPFSYWASNYVERLYSAGITGGCSVIPLNYCPDSTVTRAQMAVFLLKSMHGSSYSPPAVGGSTGFSDVTVDYWAAAWIKQLAAEGITGGCGAGIYCPDATVTRAQMAVFLLKSKHGSSYSPPNATGVFSDVPIGYWADKWIEQLAVEGVTSGCGTGIYCPDADVTRAQMAVFLVKTFNLP